jgi:hypothetical protein
VTVSRAKYLEVFISGLSVIFGIFVMRSVRVPHEKSIAPAMPLIDMVDFKRFGKGIGRKWTTGGESPYRVGDKRLTAMQEFEISKSMPSHSATRLRKVWCSTGVVGFDFVSGGTLCTTEWVLRYGVNHPISC